LGTFKEEIPQDVSLDSGHLEFGAALVLGDFALDGLFGKEGFEAAPLVRVGYIHELKLPSENDESVLLRQDGVDFVLKFAEHGLNVLLCL